VVKAGLIGDPALFDLCEREGAAVAARRLDVVEPALRRAVAVKAAIVGRDPREAGERRALNLGHTLGHALEAAAEGALAHGEAVAIGLVAAARLSEREGVGEPGLAERVAAVITALGLPVRPPADLDPERVLAFARQDKKRTAGATHAVLVARPGAVEIRAIEEAALERWVRETLALGPARAGSAA
jgi:3-dehydroquinate synthetase